MTRTMRLVLALILFLCPARAWAHAHLKRSEPAAGSKVASPPDVIRLWVSERPELSMTFVSLKAALPTKSPAQVGTVTNTLGGANVAPAGSANGESGEDAASSLGNSLARAFSFVGIR